MTMTKDELSTGAIFALIAMMGIMLGVLSGRNQEQKEIIERQSVEISILKQELESAREMAE
jgi:hypothetical protein